jgi:hypothetical protein
VTQVGIGVLAGLADTDAETLYAQLAAGGRTLRPAAP